MVVAIVGVSLSAITASGNEESAPPVEATTAATSEPVHVESETVDYVSKPTSDYLPCTDARERANFTFYSLGPIFEGLPQVAVLRECGKPFADEPIRANSVTFVYGVAPGVPCLETTGDGEGGCTPPLQVISEPICEIGPADYDRGQGGHGYLLRGVPAADFDGGTRVELYAGGTTISVSGGDPKQVSAAVDALRAEPADNAPATSLAATNKGSDGDFPEPLPGALDGTLRCNSGPQGAS